MNNIFIPSDGWFLEKDKAWFLGTYYNGIFKVNINEQSCRLVCDLPIENIWKAREISRCIKLENYIICLPNYGCEIFIYDITTKKFNRIEIREKHKDGLSIYHCWEMNKKIIAFSRTWQKLLIIDVERATVEFSDSNQENTKIMYVIKVDNYLWMANSIDNTVFSYDIESKEWRNYKLPNIKGGLYGICYDGRKFWLTGYRREIYEWDLQSNSVSVYNEFPSEFGVYNVEDYSLNNKTLIYKEEPFNHCLFLNNAVWCIPFRANMIIKIDIITKHIKGIEDGDSVKEIFSNRLGHKYLLEYIRENRYIGLYSLTRNCIIEIDTEHDMIEEKEYVLENAYDFSKKNAILKEDALDIYIFGEMLRSERSEK